MGWIVDITIGAVVGTIVGAIVAINVGLLLGIDYEQAISGAFSRTSWGGWLVTLLLVAGPVCGVWLMRKLRADRRSLPVSR